MSDTNWDLHYQTWHDAKGSCGELGRDCPNEGWVLTVSGPALADDPNRQWTEDEINQGKPWKQR